MGDRPLDRPQKMQQEQTTSAQGRLYDEANAMRMAGQSGGMVEQPRGMLGQSGESARLAKLVKGNVNAIFDEKKPEDRSDAERQARKPKEEQLKDILVSAAIKSAGQNGNSLPPGLMDRLKEVAGDIAQQVNDATLNSINKDTVASNLPPELKTYFAQCLLNESRAKTNSLGKANGSVRTAEDPKNPELYRRIYGDEQTAKALSEGREIWEEMHPSRMRQLRKFFDSTLDSLMGGSDKSPRNDYTSIPSGSDLPPPQQ